MDCMERLEGFLREQGVPFDVQEHAVAFTAQKVAAYEHVPGRMFAKVVMVDVEGELVMLVVPAPSSVDTERASDVVGGRPVRLAAERDFAPRFPDCEAGAMPPFGNLYDVPVVVDRSLGDNDHIVFQAGSHSVTMTVAYGDFERLVHPRIGDIAATRR